MKAAIISKPHGDFEIVERPIPTPGPGQVVLKTKACGICQGDSIVKDNHWHLPYPRVPGHEIIGAVHQAGPGVEAPFSTVGKVFGVGWAGASCGSCANCAGGRRDQCRMHIMTGINFDGGLSEYVLVHASALVEIPDGMDAAETAPLLCAGITVFGALRKNGILPGSIVGIQGLGGLGSIGVSMARSMGFRTVGISTSDSKRDLAFSFGAEAFVNTSGDGAVEKIMAATGGHGLDAVIATAPSAAAVEALLPGLAFGGVVVVVAALDRNLSLNPGLMLKNNLRIVFQTAGAAHENAENVRFAKAFGIKPLVERFPLERVGEAYDRMITNKVRFRSVVVFE
ncbi:hypothetical protein HK105_206668 [Polyrhizophydium stewartii]|uniref:Enoyl reductase (ER) domain-containing protein n=1 Tax=Polyrhizophydium stewartii TaxID=2732419 RepID=A0ABR4N2R3_9FUNG|nr:hypothetical protein HK105_002249 [Polyrhizophydium stewartii]